MVRFNKPTCDGLKYVFQKGPICAVVSRTGVWKIDVVNELTQMCLYRLPEGAVCPADFDGSNLVIMDKQSDPKKATVSIQSVNGATPMQLSEMYLPEESPLVTQIKLWPPDRLVTVYKQKTLVVYNSVTRLLERSWYGHTDDVVALDTSHKDHLVSVGVDSAVCVWDYVNSCCVHRVVVPGITFSLGFPYYVGSNPDLSQIIFTTDEGVMCVSFFKSLIYPSPNSLLHTLGASTKVAAPIGTPKPESLANRRELANPPHLDSIV
eukprot:Platyproteum_vivax@DN5528_c0_g1_i3.p1